MRFIGAADGSGWKQGCAGHVWSMEELAALLEPKESSNTGLQRRKVECRRFQSFTPSTRRLNPLRKESTTTTVPAPQAEIYHPPSVVAALVDIGFATTVQSGIERANNH
jgi:hypothetical protein